MSREVDERVVLMQFDNRHFEANVKTTMSTLDKLKAKLHLPGAAKGLEDVERASKKVNFLHIHHALDAVKPKFSAMYTVADQAFRNMTNSAMAAGKRIVNAFTIDPVKTGFSEYETKINSIQTIMSNTASKGTTMEDVTRVIDELNTYADQTIYNFAEMTRNIGTFTAAGVGLEESASAIKGIANLAAASGSNSQQASTAMYQLSQALSAGTVKLMDWNSVVNAGMGGEKFQEALKATAREMGISVDSIIKKNGSFRDSLQEGWLSADVLNTTLRKFTKEGAAEYAEAMVKSGKYTQEQADALIKEAESMNDAATKVKTFTQLMDTLKESVQSGWGKTWELLIGDFEEAKEMFSGIAKVLGGFIDKFSDARNKLLESALGKSFKSLLEPLQGANKAIEGISEPIKAVTKTLDDYNAVVKEVIRGDWGTTQKRWDALTEAGYDWVTVQNMVNEELGCSLRRQTDFVIGQASVKKSTEETTEADNAYIAMLTKKSEAELRDLDLTEDQITAIQELKKQSDKLGLSVEDFLANIDELDGRWVLMNSFKNLGQGLIKIFKDLGLAWRDVFDPATSDQLYDVMAGFHKATVKFNEFATSITTNEEKAGKLRRTFAGLFAILDMVTTITGGAFKMVFKIVTGVLGAFDLSILDVTAAIGDVLVKMSDWIDKHNIFTKVVDAVVPVLKKAVTAIREWFAGLKEADNIPKYILQGLANGLSNGIKAVLDIVVNIAKSIIDTVKKILGIHSPSTVFFEIGKNIIQGLVNGIKAIASEVWKYLQWMGNGLKKIFGKAGEVGSGITGGFSSVVTTVWDLVKNVAYKIVEFIKDIEIGELIAAAIGTGILVGAYKLLDVVSMFAAPLEGLGDMFQGIGSFFTDFGKGAKSFLQGAGLEMKAKAIQSFATAILILTIAIYAMSKIPVASLWIAIGAIAVLAAIMGGLAFAISKVGSVQNIGKLALSLLGISAAMFILATVLKKLSDIDDYSQAVKGFALIITGLVVVLYMFSKMGKVGEHADKVGKMLLKFSIALIIMIGAIKIISGMKPGDIAKGLITIGFLTAFIGGLVFITAFAGEHADKAAKMISKFSIALIIMAAAMKIIATMSPGDIAKGLITIGFLSIFVSMMVAVTLLAGEHADKAGKMMQKFGVALILMAAAMKIIATMKVEDIAKGLVVISILSYFAMGLIVVSYLAGEHASKAGTMLVKLAGAILLLTGVIFLISLLSWETIGKGLVVIGALELLFGGLIAVTAIAKDSDNMVKILTVMTVAIAILVAAVIALSFIEPKKLAGAVVALGLVMAAFALIIVSTSKARNLKVKTLVSLVAIVTILAGLVALLSFINPDSAMETSVGLAALMVAMAYCLQTINKVNVSVGRAMKAVVALTLLAAPLAAFAFILSKTGKIDNAISTVGALTILMVAMTVLLVPLKYIGQSAVSMLTGILGLTLLAVPLLVFVEILSMMNNLTNAMENVKILVILTGALTLMMIPLALVGLIGPVALIGVLALTAMAVPMLTFVAILTMMDGLSNAMANVFLITTLMNVMGDLLFKISIVAPLAMLGVAAMAALTLLIGAIGVFAVAIGALVTEFPSLQTFLDIGIPIMVQLAGAIGTMIGTFIASLAESVMSILPMIADQLSSFITKLQPFIEGVRAVDASVVAGAGLLAAAIIAISVAEFIAGIAQLLTFGTTTFITLASDLSAFALQLMPFVATAALVKPEMVSGVSRIADVIMTLTAASVLDGLASLFGCESGIEKFASQMPLLGEGLRGFMDKIGTFSDDDVTTVDCASKAVKALAEAAAAVPNTGGLLGELVGDNDLDDFANMFPVLGTGLMMFLKNIGTFTDEEIATINCASEAVKTLASAAKEIPNTGGLLGDLVGDNDLDDFANMFPVLGTGIRQFLTNLGTFTEDEQATVTCAADAVKTLAAASKEIPNTGGLLAKLVGDNGLGDFADQFPKVGTGIKGLLTNIGTFSEDEIATVDCAANAVAVLAKVSQDIPDTGGLLSKLVGDNNLGDFADEIPKVGKGLRGFADNIGTFSEAQVASVDLAVQALKAMVQLANLDFDDMEDSFDSFVDIVPELGSVMPEFASAMVSASAVGVDINVAGLNMIHSAGTKLGDIIKAMPAEGFENVFKEAGMLKVRLGTLVEAFKSYSLIAMEISAEGLQKGTSAGESVSGLINSLPANFTDTMKDAATFKGRLIYFAEAMKGFMDTMAGVDIGKLNTITSNLEPIMEKFSKIGQNGFNKFSESFSSKAPDLNKSINDMLTTAYTAMEQHVNKFIKAGGDLGDGLAKGIESKGEDVNKKAKALGDNAVTYITDKSFYTDFYNAGASVAEGFANGISDNTYKATAKAAAMAAAAYEKAKEELDVNSPSKIFRKLGYSVPEGFAMGIDKMGDMVDKSSTSMASSAISSARNAIGRIVDIINGNMDVQPTIRPVMDLSDVTAGAGVINGMFGRTPSLGLRANVGSITSMMNNRQNGGNNDVVSAIDSLKDIIGKSSGNTYSIGGITYDDGSAIASAVQEIVRATRIEGRR